MINVIIVARHLLKTRFRDVTDAFNVNGEVIILIQSHFRVIVMGNTWVTQRSAD